MEKYGIGWTIWDGSFSFLSGRRGQLTVDEPIIKALGLQIPLRYSSRIIPH